MIFAAIVAFTVMVFRLALYLLGRPVEGMDFMLVHFLAIVTVVFFTGQRMMMRDPWVGFPDLLRNGFRNAALYALMMGTFLWLYYVWVEDGKFEAHVDMMVQRGVAEDQPEEIIRPRMEQFFTPFNYATISFFAMLITGAFQALLIGLVHHKLLRRFTR